MHNFKELKIWQDSLELAKDIYKITKAFPASEQYGLTSQLNRSAVSIPSNIAEGAGRNSDKEFSRFLSIALGSAFELETQLLLAGSFGFAKEPELNASLEKINKIQKMINGFRTTLVRSYA
jgi:four helix bundle protein